MSTRRTAPRNLPRLFCVPSLFLAASAVRGAEQNLISQPSFEAPRALDAWTIQQSAGTSVRLDTTVGRSGKTSVVIETAAGQEKNSYPAVKFSVVPEPGECYRAEVWIKSECQNELGGFLVFETTKGGQRFELIDGDQPGPKTNGWVKATAATVVATGAEKLTVGLVAHGAGTGDLEFSIDGGEWQTCPRFDAGCLKGVRSRSRCLASGLAPDRGHEVQVRVAAKQPKGSQGRFVRIGSLLVDGDVADPFAGKTPLERLDGLYAAMDPLRYTPPAERWQRIPRTMQRLREGGTLKIVLLGDSIMNQTCHSGFGLLLQRRYPKVKIESVASVRGSTGCWWYKEENRVQEYVLKHHPDLLMIGGISQRNDVDSIREVIHQVRAKDQPEILLMTPAFGFEGSDFIKEWTYEVKADGKDYRAQLLRLASEEGCEFLDMTGPWWQYVQDSGKTYGWFRGDAVHANERGTQILARILERYFTR